MYVYPKYTVSYHSRQPRIDSIHNKKRPVLPHAIAYNTHTHTNQPVVGEAHDHITSI